MKLPKNREEWTENMNNKYTRLWLTTRRKFKALSVEEVNVRARYLLEQEMAAKDEAVQP